MEDSRDVSPILDATDPQTWGPSLDEAVNAVARGQVIVLPTDTVYGVGADAFTPPAVKALLAAKGRGRQMPPPVLIPDVRTLDGLATAIPGAARSLGLALPGTATAQQLFSACVAQGGAAWDHSGLVRALERLSGVEIGRTAGDTVSSS